MDKLKRVLQGNEDDDDEVSIVAQVYEGTSFSWETRLKGFAACFITGCMLALLSLLLLTFPTPWSVKLFALFYSIANILIIIGSLFLMGPMKQLQRMLSEKRIIPTIIFIVCMALTICAAMWWDSALLAIFFCVCQFLAFAWYAISYIPYAHNAVKNCCGSCIDV